MPKEMKADKFLRALEELGAVLDWPSPVEILLVGGLAGMITGAFSPDRVTGDCDVGECSPAEAIESLVKIAPDVADRLGLLRDWFNFRARDLNVLPPG